jgi:hypothetical protein
MGEFVKDCWAVEVGQGNRVQKAQDTKYFHAGLVPVPEMHTGMS